MPKLSYHAIHRADERMKLAPDSAKRMASRALAEGYRPELFSGSFRRYLDAIELRDEEDTAQIRIYGEFLYLFGRQSTLITVYQIPVPYRKALARARSVYPIGA